MHGIHLKGGKMIAREQTEEEKEAIEAAKVQKKPAPPAKGQAPAAVDPAVLEKLQEDIKAKNEKNEQLRQEWDSLSTNQKFFRLCEDPYKEPAVRFVKELQASQEGLEPSHIQTIELKEDALRAFESDVCE